MNKRLTKKILTTGLALIVIALMVPAGTVVAQLEQEVEIIDERKGTIDFFVGSTPETFLTNEEIATNDSNDTITLDFSRTTIYRESFTKIAIAILAILISIQGIRYITSDERNAPSFKKEMMRYLVAVLLIYLTPYILKGSINMANLWNETFLQGKTVTEYDSSVFTEQDFDYIEKFADDSNGGNQPVSPLQQLTQIMGFYSGNIENAVIEMIHRVFLFFILFQFIMRFISLYFLSIIYPLVMPFFLLEKTRNVVTTFFKMWITNLIHQPIFILGYVILGNMIPDRLNTGFSITSTFIDIGILVFLIGVNVLAGRLVGDAWTAVANNVAAGMATGAVLKGAQIFTKPAKDYAKSSWGGNPNSFYGFAGKQIGKLTGQKTKVNKETKPGGSRLSVDEQTKSNKRIKPTESKPGINKKTETGVENVRSTMYRTKQPDKNGNFAHFKSRKDALKAGFSEKEITAIKI